MDFEQRIEYRTERADGYDKRTGLQRDWYSKKASSSKNTFRVIAVAILALGALVGVAPIAVNFLGDAEPARSWTDFLISMFGAAIVVLKGIERIWLPEETWHNYRKAAEALKRERESYIEGINQYRQLTDEDKAYRLYVSRCVQIKAEEQNNFWGLSDSEAPVEKAGS